MFFSNKYYAKLAIKEADQLKKKLESNKKVDKYN